jgi:hypothetical protein
MRKILIWVGLVATQLQGIAADSIVEVGTRRELFLDDYLIREIRGGARKQLHHPQPQDIAIVHDAPWEGSGTGYHSVFRDGDIYRMYYKAWQLDVQDGKVLTNAHPLFTCYAESKDGIKWTKPMLGLHEFRGSKENNIVMAPGKIGRADPDPGHIAIFKDENPTAGKDARYKAIVRSNKPKGLLAFKSADGLHWMPMSEEPVITDGAFDSQNLAFWDASVGKYRAYWRYFTAEGTDEENWKPSGDRAIRTAVSDDFIHWEKPQDLQYTDSPSEQLYTNQIKPYHRAPHLLLGFPTRYIERDWSPSMQALPERTHREARALGNKRYGTAVTEALVMCSRDGVHFKRWNEAFMRPGIERPGTWNYGQQYIAWHVVETASSLEGAPSELSFYATESYWTDTSSALRRYTMRLDGFASISAPMTGGELVTKPLRFSGHTLELNFSTSAAGGLKVEIQEQDGKPITGYSINDCDDLFGDSIARKVSWKGQTSVRSMAGRAVRLRFLMKDADLYALQFDDMGTY